MRLLSRILVLAMALAHGTLSAETPMAGRIISPPPTIDDVREGQCDCSMQCANGDAYSVRTVCYYVYYAENPSTPGSIYATDPATTAGYCEEQGGMVRRTCADPRPAPETAKQKQDRLDYEFDSRFPRSKPRTLDWNE